MTYQSYQKQRGFFVLTRFMSIASGMELWYSEGSKQKTLKLQLVLDSSRAGWTSATARGKYKLIFRLERETVTTEARLTERVLLKRRYPVYVPYLNFITVRKVTT